MKTKRAAPKRVALGASFGAMPARDREVRRLRALAKRVRKLADLVDVAATYWSDGAYITTRDRLRVAQSRLARSAGYIGRNQWHEKQ